MTLRAVIQGLMRGSDDAEAMLAEDGYDDLPAEMFGQALSSYADTAPMEEADALSPILTTMEAGEASDVFAVLQEQPLVLGTPGELGASALGASALDDVLDDEATDLDDGGLDAIDDFGAAAPDDDAAHSEDADDANPFSTGDVEDLAEDAVPESLTDSDDPFAAEDLFDADELTDTVTEFAEQEEFFDTEPVATGEDPSDLDF